MNSDGELMHILIVDDHPRIRRFLTESLYLLVMQYAALQAWKKLCGNRAQG